MNAAMRCSCMNMSAGLVRGSAPGPSHPLSAAVLPTARSMISGQRLVSASKQRSRAPAAMSVRAMAATASAGTLYDYSLKVRHTLLP